MERLTKAYDDGTHVAADNLPCGENSWNYKELLLNKLGAYEDTGLEPEEIMDGKMLTGWIPVEECLPEEGAEVMVTVNGGDKIDTFVSSDVFVAEEWQNWNGVIAWMPLPEPFNPQN